MIAGAVVFGVSDDRAGDDMPRLVRPARFTSAERIIPI